MRDDCQRGVALLAVLVLSALVTTIALGLSLLLSFHHLRLRNARDAVVLTYAARAGVELAAQALDAADWNAVLSGLAQAPGVDGPPGGVRVIGATRIDLGAETHLANCGAAAGCDAAALGAATRERPWGDDNPTWRLYLYGPLRTLAGFTRAAPVYVLVWVGDDGREVDGNPDADGGGAAASGRDIVVIRAVAIGASGGRRGYEAEALRVCATREAIPVCQPGIRVQSWRDLRWSVP